MAKSTPIVVLSKNQQGQISIFFSASLIVLISIIAFVINVGLFVKAKINLQNATDAAAFSGAAVQARQLTKIAYLNWEMRNIYKEWMYKYYVVGNLNVKDVVDPSGTDPMNFRLEADYNVLANSRAEDPFNFPSVCIHLNGSKTNICKRYAIPGLPEFGGYNLPGPEEASRNFIDTLIKTKVDDCIDRTRLNALVNTTWAYNVLTKNGADVNNSLVGQGPAIMADRQGAWPRAIELALRMRNLELVVNRPAQDDGVCIRPGNGANLKCTKAVSDVISDNKLGNERIVKAFYSGYRNLGNATDNEMKETFTLTEIPPKAVSLGNKFSASYLLVPEDRIQSYEKQYLDLKLMMINYAVFYSAMIPRATNDTSGACDVSKVAIPVPGYPLGFYKNPDLVTYYAVKGEAEFIGMFNPFGGVPIKLTAYAAAKPFGGRIGPMLFVQREGVSFFTGRTDNSKFRSVPYIASLDFRGSPKKNSTGVLANGEFSPGTPLPINFDGDQPGYFWLKTPQSALGGIITDTQGVQFGIPNMVYDYESGFSTTGYTENDAQIHIIKPGDGIAGDRKIGLFSRYQFRKFKGEIGGVVSAETLTNQIARVKAATVYESANYMIPTPSEFNLDNKLDSFGFITGAKKDMTGGVSQYNAYIYAPLYEVRNQSDVLFKNPAEVVKTIFQFMRTQESGIKKYRTSLNAGARAIYNSTPGGAAINTVAAYRTAAGGVSDIDFSDPSNDQTPKTCTSIAGQFLYFYYGHNDLRPGLAPSITTGCPTTLGEMITKYFSTASIESGFLASHYSMEYSFLESNFKDSPNKSLGLMSAYSPGRYSGVGDDGTFSSPFPGSGITEVMKRNFYSTKFVPLASLRSAGGYNESSTNFVIYSEGDLVRLQGQDRAQTSFKNTLDAERVGIDLSSIKY